MKTTEVVVSSTDAVAPTVLPETVTPQSVMDAPAVEGVAGDSEAGEKKPFYTDEEISKYNRRAKKDSFLLMLLLANAEAGAAVLSLPSVYAASGVILAMVYMVVSLAFSFYGFWILIRASHYTNSVSLAQLAQRTYGKGFSILCDVCLAFVLIGFLCSYISVTADYILRGVQDIYQFVHPGEEILAESYWPMVFRIVAAFIILFPLTLPRSIESLNTVSSVAIVFFLATSIAIFYYFGKFNSDGQKITFMIKDTVIDRSHAGVPLSPQGSLSKVLSYYSYFFSLYTLQANIPPVLGEMKGAYENRPKYLWISSLGSTCFVAVFYIAVGICGALMFDYKCPAEQSGITCWKLDSNILSSFKNVLPMTIIKLLYAVVMAVSYPVMLQPCRVSVLGWFKAPSKYTKKGHKYFILVGFVVTLISVIISVSIPSIDTAITIFSIVFGCFTYQLLPLFVHIKLPMFKKYYEKRIKEKLEDRQNTNANCDNQGAIDISYVSYNFDSSRQSLNLALRKSLDAQIAEENLTNEVLAEQNKDTVVNNVVDVLSEKAQQHNHEDEESSNTDLEFVSSNNAANKNNDKNEESTNGTNRDYRSGSQFGHVMLPLPGVSSERKLSVHLIGDRRGSFTSVFANRLSVELSNSRRSSLIATRRSLSVNTENMNAPVVNAAIEAEIAAELRKREKFAEMLAKETSKAEEILNKVIGGPETGDINDEQWMRQQDAKMTFAAELNEGDRESKVELAKDPKKQDERVIESKFIPSIGKYRGAMPRHNWLMFLVAFLIAVNTVSLVGQIIDFTQS